MTQSLKPQTQTLNRSLLCSESKRYEACNVEYDECQFEKPCAVTDNACTSNNKSEHVSMNPIMVLAEKLLRVHGLKSVLTERGVQKMSTILAAVSDPSAAFQSCLTIMIWIWKA